MITKQEIDKKIAELYIEKAIEDKDVPYVIINIYGLIQEVQKQTIYQIFAELDNLHIVESWSTQKGKKIPLLLNQITTYKDIKKKFKVD